LVFHGNVFPYELLRLLAGEIAIDVGEALVAGRVRDSGVLRIYADHFFIQDAAG
jgi:hypothetical protein